jgi:phosphoglycolate phosphatase
VGDVQPRLIAFDLDGTLIDSQRDLADSANELIVELGGSPLTEAAIARMVGGGATLLVRRALAAAGLVDPPGAVARFLDIYDTRLLNHTRPYEGVPEAVRRAREYGRVVVLTNKPKDASERILHGLDLRDLFDTVVGGDGPLPKKPDPAALLSLVAAAGASPATALMVGDSAIDHETALAAGTACCLVAYGFGFLNFPRERLTGRESIVHSPHELPDVFARFASTARGARVPGAP